MQTTYDGYPSDDIDGPTMGSLWCRRRVLFGTNELLAYFHSPRMVTCRLRGLTLTLWDSSTSSMMIRCVGRPTLSKQWPFAHLKGSRPCVSATDAQPTCVQHLRRGARGASCAPSARLVPGACGSSKPTAATRALFVLSITIKYLTCSFDECHYLLARYNQTIGEPWAPRLAEFVAQWATATDDVVMEDRPHDDAAWVPPLVPPTQKSSCVAYATRVATTHTIDDGHVPYRER
ncbi:LOW QUALITY PROTEIN: hypothetical protein U9M48_020375 [Paspalum notatum var. saurae]|uniref:Uncharacterized protein n=1 Tax=Paspalum notatum var. saurae TaxID=547442 RepID=A0AAQ3WSI3_PASNO